jgi:hypothetical protein
LPPPARQPSGDEMTEERVEHLLAEVHDEFGMIRVF